MANQNDEPVTAGSMLASILKKEGKYSEEDLTRQMMEDMPNADFVSNGDLVGSRDDEGEIVIEDRSVKQIDTLQ